MNENPTARRPARYARPDSIRTHMEFEMAGGRHRLIHHPDLGWGWYTQYGQGGDWEREESLTRAEVWAELDLGNFYRVGG